MIKETVALLCIAVSTGVSAWDEGKFTCICQINALAQIDTNGEAGSWNAPVSTQLVVTNSGPGWAGSPSGSFFDDPCKRATLTASVETPTDYLRCGSELSDSFLLSKAGVMHYYRETDGGVKEIGSGTCTDITNQ